MCSVTKSSSKNTKPSVKLSNGLVVTFVVTCGVKQCYILSPTLSSLFRNDLSIKLNSQHYDI